MDLLTVLFPKVRAEVLRLLFADPATELHLRELTRRSGLALGTVQVELAKLVAAGLVVAERDGNRRYFRAESGHPAFGALQQLVLGGGGPTVRPRSTAAPGAASSAPTASAVKAAKPAPKDPGPPSSVQRRSKAHRVEDSGERQNDHRPPLVLDLSRLD